MNRVLACGCVALLLCGGAAWAKAPAKPAGPCRSDLASTVAAYPTTARAVARIEQEMATRHIPGLQAAAVKNGRIVMLESCGIANLEFDAPVVRSTRFQIASATKTFTGVAVMQLVEEGKLKLDAPIADYLDGLPVNWRTVTVRQALMHVSGLPDMVDPQMGNLIDAGGESASWAKVQTLPLMFAPGQGYAYNQTNYLLLGRIIDKLRGKPFTEVMREREFDVAGMKSAVFADSYDVVPGRAQVYAMRKMVDGKMMPSDTPMPHIFGYPLGLRTGAGLMLTAEDAAKWIIALTSGKMLKPETRKEMWTTGKMPDGKPTVWALGWPAFPRAEHPAVAGIGGASAAFFVYPEDDVALVIFTNLSGGQPEQFIEQVAQFYGSNPP